MYWLTGRIDVGSVDMYSSMERSNHTISSVPQAMLYRYVKCVCTRICVCACVCLSVCLCTHMFVRTSACCKNNNNQSLHAYVSPRVLYISNVSKCCLLLGWHSHWYIDCKGKRPLICFSQTASRNGPQWKGRESRWSHWGIGPLTCCKLTGNHKYVF